MTNENDDGRLHCLVPGCERSVVRFGRLRNAEEYICGPHARLVGEAGVPGTPGPRKRRSKAWRDHIKAVLAAALAGK